MVLSCQHQFDAITDGHQVCVKCGQVSSNVLYVEDNVEFGSLPKTFNQSWKHSRSNRNQLDTVKLKQKLFQSLHVLKLPSSLHSFVWNRFNQVQETNQIGLQQKGFVALICCLFLVSREKGYKIPIKEMTGTLGLSFSLVKPVLRVIRSSLGMNSDAIPPNTFFEELCNLIYPPESVEDGLRLCNSLYTLMEDRFSVNKQPGIVAISIVIVSKEALVGKKLSDYEKQILFNHLPCGQSTAHRTVKMIHDTLLELVADNPNFADAKGTRLYPLLYDLIQAVLPECIS